MLASNSGAYTPGVSYTCELGDNESKTFYVLETNGDNVSLIAGMNLGTNVAWVTIGDYIAAGETVENGDYVKNDKGPITADKILKERTSGWTKLEDNQISIPSGQQIAAASGKEFDVSSTSNVSGLPIWLNSYTKPPMAYGYWTSSPSTSSSNKAYYVFYDGTLYDTAVIDDSAFALRPVITIPKSQLG